MTMRLTSGCILLFILIICCWQCMGMPQHDKKRPPVHKPHPKEDKHESHSHEHSHEHPSSKEDEHEPHSHEHSHEHPHEHPSCKEDKHGSHSHEHSSSKEKKDSSSSEDNSSSKEKGRSCTNGKRNEQETDVDCGGNKCSPCVNGKKCSVNRDCISRVCKDGRCTQKPTKKPSTKTTKKAITTTATEEPVTATTTTAEEIVTTPEEPVTTPEETTPTPEEIISVTTEETMIAREPVCSPTCQNGGACTADNVCICPVDFSGPLCEVQSVGLCRDEETFDAEPILNITFGKGSRPFSLAKPSDFNFNTTYTQREEPPIHDGHFAFINSVYEHFNAWHTGAKDHTGDENGYMYMVNANFEPGQFYSGKVNNLCIGLRYEFSVYLANICKKRGGIEPNVLFEVRTADGNELLAQLNSGDVPEHDTLTWGKYGMSFIATHSSVKLLMISNTRGGGGNDIVIDDIALRVCAHKGSGFCPSK